MCLEHSRPSRLVPESAGYVGQTCFQYKYQLACEPSNVAYAFVAVTMDIKGLLEVSLSERVLKAFVSQQYMQAGSNWT